MTKSEKRAVRARAEELMKKGVEKVIAEVMAKAEFDTGIIKPVVNGNF